MSENRPIDTGYTPDVLSCLADLSNDEVFTPPEVARAMIDLLPDELFTNPDTTFLEPACKSGVFLREIAKRLLIGLQDKIPNLQERLDHILHKQLFGIAITELTSLMSRRSLYCSKYPNGKYSVSAFDDIQGNIRFKSCEHTFGAGKCEYCGAPERTFSPKARGGLESHAYEFIHTTKPEDIFKMKFDVIIGNPPYQLDDGGAQASAKPIYNLFIEQAKKLNPRYLVMITPSRWFAGGKGLDDFRKETLHDNRLKEIHDFPDASDCFPGVEIKGGVNYFLWDRSYHGDCEVVTHEHGKITSSIKRPLLEKGNDFFIRNNNLISVFHKVKSVNEKPFSSIVSSMKPFGIRGDFFKDQAKYGLPSVATNPIVDGITIYGIDEHQKRTTRYVSKSYPLPKKDLLGGYKLFMARNQGSGILGEKFSIPVFAGPNEACTETFVVIGPFKTKEEMQNCWSYMKTKFFRAILSLRKNDQGAGQAVYSLIPLQDFSRPWSDADLYEKYSLTKEEQEYIEIHVESMEEE